MRVTVELIFYSKEFYSILNLKETFLNFAQFHTKSFIYIFRSWYEKNCHHLRALDVKKLFLDAKQDSFHSPWNNIIITIHRLEAKM
jgi:hypothetical protein